VEIGRLALVNYGKDYGRLVVIVDIVDQNRVSSSDRRFSGWVVISFLDVDFVNLSATMD
jgi:hypothetical protein